MVEDGVRRWGHVLVLSEGEGGRVLVYDPSRTVYGGLGLIAQTIPQLACKTFSFEEGNQVGAAIKPYSYCT